MSGGLDVPDPLSDDAYRDLFRAEPAEVESVEESTPAAHTGRLFRTYRADTKTEAIIALRPDRARRLRSMEIVDEVPAPPTALPDEPVEVLVESREPRRKPRASTSTPSRSRPRRAPGLRPGAVYVIDIVITVLVAFAEVLVRGGGIGWVTGVALLIVSGYTAWVIRLDDWVVAAIAPPIAFFVAALTAGQVGLADTSVVNRAAQVFFTLGTNWFWVLGAVALAFALTVLRRRLSP